jgi:hypothetical protein
MGFNWAFINPAADNPPDLSIQVSGLTATSSLAAQNLTASVTGGTQPYAYNWNSTRPNGVTSSSEFSTTSGSATVFTPAAVGLYSVTCTVTDNSTTTLSASATQSKVVGTTLATTVSGLASTSSIAAQALTASSTDGSGTKSYNWFVRRPDNSISTSEFSEGASNASASVKFNVQQVGLNVVTVTTTDASSAIIVTTASAVIGITGSDLSLVASGLAATSSLAPQNLSSTVNGGISPYFFSWSATRPDGSASTSEFSSTSASAPVFTPQRVGLYAVKCTVSDSTTTIQNLTASSTQAKVIGVDLRAEITGLTATTSTAPQSLTASAVGGTGSYSYVWSVVRPDASISTSEFSEGASNASASVKFTLGYAGLNVVRCNVTDASSVTFVATSSAEIGITGSDLSNVTTGFSAASNLNPQNLTSSVTGGIEPYSFSWSAIRPDGSTSTSEFSTTSGSTTVFTPARVGLYAVACTATDSSSPILTASSTQSKVVGTTLSVSISGITTTASMAPTDVTASAAGGTGGYAYLWSNANSSNSVSNSEYSNFSSSPLSKSATFTPAFVGLNVLSVKVTDSSGVTATATSSVSLGITGSDFSLTISGLAATSSLATQALSASPVGDGAPYAYGWSCVRPDGSTSTSEFSSTTSRTPNFSPLRVGAYSVTCTATDSSTPALTASATQAKFIGETLTGFITGLASTSSMSAQDLTASVAGGSGSYSFSWSNGQSVTGSSTAEFSNFSINSGSLFLSQSVTFTPSITGLNVITVDITDQAGGAFTATASATLGITGSDFSLTTSGLAATASLATQALSASPVGDGAPYAYSWSCVRPDGSTSTSEFSSTTSRTPNFSPLRIGLYSVTCTSTDSSVPALTASSTQAKFIGQELVGTIIGLSTTASTNAQTLTCSVVGGSGSYTFEYSVITPAGVAATAGFSNFSINSGSLFLSQSCVFSASIQGSNVVRCTVSDQAGNKFFATSSAFIGVTSSGGAGDLSATLSGFAAATNLNGQNVTCSVLGGTAPLSFSYVATRPDGSTSTSEFAPSASAQNVVFTPARVGLYSVTCTVIDSASPALTASSTLAKSVGQELVAHITSAAGGAIDTVAFTAQELTASLTGAGTGGESYLWEALRPDGTSGSTEYANFSASPLSQSTIFTATQKGVYTHRASITDSSGENIIVTASANYGTGLATEGEMVTVIPNVTYGTWTVVSGSAASVTGLFSSSAETGQTNFSLTGRPGSDAKFPNRWVMLQSPVQNSFNFNEGGVLTLQMQNMETSAHPVDAEEIFAFGISSTDYNGNDSSVDFCYIGHLGVAGSDGSKVFFRLGAQNQAGSTQGTTDPLEGAVFQAMVTFASGGTPQSINATSWESDGTNTGYGVSTSTQPDFTNSDDVRFFVAIGGDSAGTSALPITASYTLRAGFTNTNLYNIIDQ